MVPTKKPLLLQTYKRDTGEIMHDLSVPIYINGKHWGGFRVGYQPEKETAEGLSDQQAVLGNSSHRLARA